MEAKASDWRPGPTVCRCCLTEGCYKDISTEYFWMGKREVYAEMLSETLNVSIAFSKSGGPNSNSRLICEPCISRLRDAAEFKRQVIDCEKTFMHHLDPGSSSSREFNVEAIGEVKVEVVKREKQSISDDDFDDRPDFLDVDTDDDLDDQPLTKLATKIPKKESVDLLELLDSSQITVKRKSNLKLKAPPKKIVKKKEVVAKPSASKAVVPAKQVEKKKDDKWTAKDTSVDIVDTHSNSDPPDEWIIKDIRDTNTVQTDFKFVADDEWVATDIVNPIKVEVSESFDTQEKEEASYTEPENDEWIVSENLETQENLNASNAEQDDDEWIVSDITKQITGQQKTANDNPAKRVLSKNESITTAKTNKRPNVQSRPTQESADQTENDKMLWVRIGQGKWIKVAVDDTHDRSFRIRGTQKERRALRLQISGLKQADDNKRITVTKKNIRSYDVFKHAKQGKKETKRHLQNARLILKHTTAIPFRIELSSIEIPCFACRSKFKDPFSFRDHFLVEHKDVDKTKGMHLYNNVQTRADITDLACLECGKSFDTLEEIAQHLFQEHEIGIDLEERLGLVPLRFSQAGRLICIVCQKKCVSFRDLYRHSGLHYHFYVCEICGKKFESTSSLKVHHEQSHVDGFRCKACKAIFPTASERSQHVKNDRCNFLKCKICSKTFATSVLRLKHRETVHGFPKRIYQCSECSKVFEARMQLYFHSKREHTDHYKCRTCGKSFATSSGLKSHSLVHTGERPFQCGNCHQAFKNRSWWKTHLSKCNVYSDGIGE